MNYSIKCTGPDNAVCIKCASKLNLSKDQSTGYCGHCGSVMHVEFADKVNVKEDPPRRKEWIQMELFPG